MNREKLNLLAHKYLAEVVLLFGFLFLVSIFLTQKIKTNTEETLSNQKISLSNDSLSLHSLNNIEETQKLYLRDAEELRTKIKK